MDLTQLRLDAGTLLESAGLKTREYVAETITPPVAVVVPADPYLVWPEGGVTFDRQVRVRLDVLLVGNRGTNKKSAAVIDDMVEKAVTALNDAASPWAVTEVAQPNVVTLSGAKFMGSVVAIEQEIEEP